MNFDSTERDQIYGKDVQQKLTEMLHSDACINEVVYAENLYRGIWNRSFEAGPDEVERLSNSFIEVRIVSLLNNLEYFAMHFTHNTADDTVIYASLHQTYISMVEMLYCNIAAYNSPDKPSFYTNTTDLYKKWKEKRKSNDEKIVNEARRSSTQKGNSVDQY